MRVRIPLTMTVDEIRQVEVQLTDGYVDVVRVDAEARVSTLWGLFEAFPVSALERDSFEQDDHHQVETPYLKPKSDLNKDRILGKVATLKRAVQSATVIELYNFVPGREEGCTDRLVNGGNRILVAVVCTYRCCQYTEYTAAMADDTMYIH